MRSSAEIWERLIDVENMIARRKAEGRKSGGGQYTIANVLRWVLDSGADTHKRPHTATSEQNQED